MRGEYVDFVVLGGGLAGLTFGLEAGRLGRKLVVLEAEPQVGGLARTHVFGDYRFDLGGHRFLSSWPEVTKLVTESLGEGLRRVVRRSRIRLGTRYIDYPLRLPNVLGAFGFRETSHILTIYLSAFLCRRTHPEDTFEDWVVRRFGRRLYEIYFRP